MATQTALIVTEIGKPLTSTTNWPIPQPGPSQLQIRVTVAGLNPHDATSRSIGLFIKDHLPAVIGHDLAGVVTILGPGVSKFKVGDRVFAQSAIAPGHYQKALQEYAIVDEAFTAKVPEGFTDHDGVTLPTNIIAGIVALFHENGFGIPAPWTEEAKTFDYAGTTLLIIGGGSNCGKFGVQLAKLAGIGNIVVVGGDEKLLKQWGATHVLDRHGGHDVVLKRIRDIVGDDLIYSYDAFNPPEGQHLAINALSKSKKGTIARLVWAYGALDEASIEKKFAGYDVKNIIGSSHATPELSAAFWDRVGGYFTEGSIVPLEYVVVKGLDVDKVNEVLDKYRDKKPVTQTHFRVSE
jgi:NADPH2:quinone reductase